MKRSYGSSAHPGVTVRPWQRAERVLSGRGPPPPEPAAELSAAQKHTRVSLLPQRRTGAERPSWQLGCGRSKLRWELERWLRTDLSTGRARTSHSGARAPRQGPLCELPLGKADTGRNNQVLQHVLSASGLTTLDISLPKAELQLSCRLLEHTNLIFQAE